MEIFAQRVRELRKENKRKQSEVAGYLGISLRAYQYYESATNYPDVAGLMKLADYFGVTTDYLLGRSRERQSSLPGACPDVPPVPACGGNPASPQGHI